MKAPCINRRPPSNVARTALKAAGLTLGLPLATTLVSAQPDYPPAHYTPMVGCEKWWTNAADAVAYYATKYGESGPGGHYFCVVHDMEGYYWTTISYLNNCGVSASIHYMVNGLQNGSDTHGHAENNPSDPAAGDITQSVREAYYAWHAVCWNPYMFGTEHEGFVNDPAWYTEAMYQASAGLHRHLCDVWGIPKDRNHIIGHNEWQNSTWKTWMAANFPRVNPTCNTHTDPGVYWNWAHFMALITNAPGGTYWDMNGATTGAGSTPSGVWDTTSLNWSTNSIGASLTGTWSGQSAIFSAGSDATGAYAITVSGTQTVTNLLVKNGSVTFTGGQLNFSGTGGFCSNSVSAGCTAVFNTPFGGAGSPDKWGPGTAVYNGTSTSTGFFSLNQGTLRLGNDSALSTVPLRLGDPGGANFVTLQSADATAHTLANSLVLYATSFSFGAGGNLTFGGYVDVGTSSGAAKSIAVSNNVTTFSGVVSNTAGLTKTGPGTLVLSGSSANTYGSTSANGNTTVGGGTLQLSKTPGVAAVANGSLIENSGGTLRLGASDQIADTVPMTLAGGTFQTAGFSEQLGTLTLSGNSLIDLGSGASVVAFADSSGMAWTVGTTLTVTNWSGSINGGGADQLIFGANSAGLTAGQVAQIWFANPAGFPAGAYSATILSTGEVVPLATSPSITSQPADAVAVAGNNASFTVVAAGTPPPAYQWYFNGGNLPSATAATLLLPGVTTDQAGSYSVVITNLAGSTNSAIAVLSVYTPPAITTQPTNQVAVAGNDVSFTVMATGTPAPAYQWRFNGANLADGTSTTLLLPSVTLTQAGSYSVVVTNAAGSTNSATALLSVYATAAPTLSGVGLSSNGQFQLSVAGVPGYNYAVLASSNLTDWTLLQTNPSPFTFTDTNTGAFPDRFYRAQYLP